MSSAMPLATLGVVFLAPFLWSAAVAFARRRALGSGAAAPLADAHEKAVLVLMLAPIPLGMLAMLLPRDAVLGAAPPLLDLVEFAAPAAPAPFDGAAANALDWPLVLSAALLAIYAIGFARCAVPLLGAHLRLRRWVASAHPHPHISDVRVSDEAQTPLAASGGCVLFPSALLETLSADQIRLIVDHERRHHARGDVVFYAALAWIDALIWFNPFVRAQTRHCRLAAELDCDTAVTAAAPQMRRTYAQTLLTVLKHAAGSALPCAPAVFSHRSLGEHRMRILRIMKREADTRKAAAPWLAYAAALALAAPLGLSQLALAQASGTTTAAAAAPVFSHVPVAGRLTAGFGERTDPFTGQPAFHAGVDIAAAEGTPIVAPAAGQVRRIVLGHEGYGNMIEIDHGGGYRARYAMLSRIDVSEGQSVSAGQQIGAVGSSGRATGPHLHLELWLGSVVLDPALTMRLQ